MEKVLPSGGTFFCKKMFKEAALIGLKKCYQKYYKEMTFPVTIF
jgi:hypothetical protein